MSDEPKSERREYPLEGSTPWYNKLAREATERAIGRLSMFFQELEELVSCLITQLVSDDDRLGRIITAELSFRNKLALLSSLYQYRVAVPVLPESFKTLLARVRRVEERRNTILHSNWIKGAVCGMLTRYKFSAKAGTGFVHQTEDFEPKNIEATVTETIQIADDIIEHFDKAFSATAAKKVLEVLSSGRMAAFIASSERDMKRPNR